MASAFLINQANRGRSFKAGLANPRGFPEESGIFRSMGILRLFCFTKSIETTNYHELQNISGR
jgi:hypothetical protein